MADAVLNALAPETVLTDISMQGTVSRTAGSDVQSGTFTLEASGDSETRVVLSLDGGEQQELRSGPLGSKIGADGLQSPVAVHNCVTIEPWFYPGLSLQALANDPEVSILYAGSETREGVELHQLRLFRTVPGQTPEMTAQIQRLSAVDLYVDASTYLPFTLAFKTHPNDDLNVDIPVEVRFADYKVLDGIQVPTRIQRFLQGSLLLDISVSGATANSTLSDSLFAVQAE